MAQPDNQLAATTPAPLQVMPLAALARFQRLMQAEGWLVDLQRMCVDTGYAHHCLATAHTSSDAGLRRAALDLFDTYERNTAAPALH